MSARQRQAADLPLAYRDDDACDSARIALGKNKDDPVRGNRHATTHPRHIRLRRAADVALRSDVHREGDFADRVEMR